MKITLCIIGYLIVLSTSLLATDPGEFRGETKAKLEILQKQNDEFKIKINEIEKSSINTEVLKNSITDQDKRIQDLGLYVSIIANVIAILTLIAAIGGVAFPYMMYRQNSKAQEDAKKDIETWKKKTKTEFDSELNDFKTHIENAKSEVNISVEEAKKAESEIKNIQNELQNGKDIPKSKETTENGDSLSKIVDKVRKKSLNEYIFSDWNKLAFDAYKKDKKDDALFYWRRAVESCTEVSQQKVQTLFNIGVTLDQLNRKPEALDVYNELIQDLHGTQNEALQIQRAKATMNKGVTLTELSRREEAIDVYNELIQDLYGTQTEALQIQRAKAIVNKGVALAELNRSDEALDVFNELIQDLHGTQNEALQIQRANAIMNKGITFGQIGHNEEALDVFNELIQDLHGTQNEALQALRANVYINSIEIRLILGKELDETIDAELMRYIYDNNQSKLEFFMLKTLYEALKADQQIRFRELKNEFVDNNFRRWRWAELDQWANNISDTLQRERVTTTIEQFKNW